MKRPSRRTLLVVVLNVAQVLLALAWVGVHTEAVQAAARPAWGWPLHGETTVERPFVPPSTAWGAGHRGVDLQGQKGDAVLAAGEGVVTYAGLLAGRGVVTVSHAGGLRTTYEPVTAGVRVGVLVAQGQRIGTLSTGHGSCRAGATCLHWGLLRGDTYLDPLSLITQGQLRLLPTGTAAGEGTGALQATIGARTESEIGPSSPALAEPRRRMAAVLVNSAVNLTGAALVLWLLLLLARRARRLWRRVRA